MKKNICFFIASLLIFSGCQHFASMYSTSESGQYYKNQWETAQKLLKDQDTAKAEAIFKELYNSALTDDPELSTRSLFELALLSESRGEWDKALAQFKECESKRQYLPVIRAELELPARLSGLYATLGELKMSDFYSKKTESALQVYSAQIRQDQQVSWWAETFYKIGFLPVAEITNDNWISFASRFESTCQYLIRSMELSDPLWSQRSFELAQQFMKKSFESLTLDEPQDDESWEIKRSETKAKMEKLASIIDKMNLYKPLNVASSAYTKTFYQSLKLSEKELEKRWNNFKAYAPESRESKKRNSLKREGLKINSTPQEIDKTKNDPNL